MAIALYPHNENAYLAALDMLRETGKAAVIHPTGTGKSFIAFKLCEDHPDKTICWLSPSEYIFKTQLENLKAAGADVPRNIKFYTYARLMNMTDEEMAEIKPDLKVYDEFHRAGAALWSVGLRRLRDMYPEVPVLGLSATNIRYLDNQRDMADELFDGNIASEMTLGEAIIRGILAAPKYVVSVFAYHGELERLRVRVAAAQSKLVRDTAARCYEALRRALQQADGLDVIFDKHMSDRTGKYLVFTSNIEAMRECMSHVSEWFAKVDAHPHVYSLYSLDPASSKSFEAFKEDGDTTHLRLLFCIDALNEGIHVDGISGVILFRPTVSPVVYKQQIGRALSAGKETRTPVIFDIVNNFEGLYSIGAVEEEMRAAITYYNYFGDEKEVITERFRIIDEVRDCRRLFDELEGILTGSWDLMYEQASRYYQEYGNLEVPVHYRTEDGYTLGKWLVTQRQIRAGKAAGNLDEGRIARLDAIGMRWLSVHDLSWERHYAACRQYREENGDLNVPGNYVAENGLRLGAWIISVRNYRRYGIRSSYFTREREKMLDDLGMIWNQPDYLWQRNYGAALAYFAEHGNLNVPRGTVQNAVKLYNWLVDLRKMYRNEPGRRGTLTKEQIAQLDALGMCWKSQKEIVWDKGYAEARAYYEKYGAADAPVHYVSSTGYKLGVWLSKCREKYSRNALTAEQVAQLNEINMVWNKSRKNDWDECFAHARAYYLEHGDLAVPPDYVAGGVWLNKWLYEQRQILLGRREGKSLTEDQKQKLRSISFMATPLEARWQRCYQELKAYYDAHGDIRLPIGYQASNGQDLYNWLSNQRANYKVGKLSSQRASQLREIGALSAT